ADDPSLTVRPQDWRGEVYPDSDVRQPLRVVLDRQLRTPVSARLLGEPGATLIVSALDPAPQTAAALQAEGAELLHLPASGSGIDLAQLLDELGRRECNEILVEAGPTLAAAFISEQLVDELVVYMAPALLGSNARPLMVLPQLATMSDKINLQFADVTRVGNDLRMTLNLSA
ncbi:MAG: RibD family protein, partial [Alcanivoracaceae bacterium]|nr:RibD family protein [Alcanivoracaceae bacterium]